MTVCRIIMLPEHDSHSKNILSLNYLTKISQFSTKSKQQNAQLIRTLDSEEFKEFYTNAVMA